MINTECKGEIENDVEDGFRSLITTRRYYEEMEGKKISRFPKVDYSEDKDLYNTKNERTPPVKRRRMSNEEAFSDETLKKLKKPLKIGWRRVIAWRQGLSKSGSRISDIYYYPPGSNCALRSTPKILEFLQTQNIIELMGENFSFARTCLDLRSSNQIERVVSSRRPSVSPNLKMQTHVKLKRIKKEAVNEVVGAITKSAQSSPSPVDEMFPLDKIRFPILDSSDVPSPELPYPTIWSPILSSTATAPSPSCRSKRRYEDSDSDCDWVLEEKNAANGYNDSDAANHLVPAFPSALKEQKSFKNKRNVFDRDFGDAPFIGQIETSLLEPENQFTSVKSKPDVRTCAEISFFKHLLVIDLLRLMRVCKAWKDIASSPELWKVTSLNCCKIVDWSKANLFFRKYQVQILNFRGVRSTVTAFAESLKEMNFLSGFSFGSLAPYVLHYLSDSVKVLKLLESLQITVTEQRIPTLKDNEVVVDFEMFKRMRQIKNLRIQSARGFAIRAENLHMLHFCHQMTSLSLLDVKDLSDADLLFLKRMPLLETLQIGFCTKFTTDIYELMANLKNLERLRLECGDSSALFNMLLDLPKLKFLCLTKFTITDLLMDIVAAMHLTNLTIWSDFNAPTACETWSVIVNNMEKLKNNLKFLTLGFLGRGVALERMKQISDDGQTSSSSHFAVIDESQMGYLISIKVNEFVEYAEKFVPFVDLKWSKDEDLGRTR